MLTEVQIDRVLAWQALCIKYVPSWDKPDLIVQFLAKVLPDACPFSRTRYYKGLLICYIPPLCQLNPFYNAVVAEKARLAGW